VESVQTSTIMDEILDFLTSAPTLQQITEFHPSEEIQAHIRYLLEKNQTVRLSAEENEELDEVERLNHFMRMLKIKAREKLAAK